MSEISDHRDKRIAMATPRPSILRSLRFEVFKRDFFSCRHCGRRAPDVVLYCDHIKPLAEGGEYSFSNLTTACVDCNPGKRPDEPSTQSILSQRLAQLTTVQEREEQMEMLIEWQKELSKLDEIPVTRLDEQWISCTGYRLGEAGKAKIRNLVKKYGFTLVAEAMRTAADQYLERNESGAATEESMGKCFDSIGAIASVEHAEQREPGSRRMFVIRDELRKRLSHCPHAHALNLIRTAARGGASLDVINKIADDAPTWSHFRNAMENLISEKEKGQANWRAGIFQRLDHFSGQVPEDELIGLISRALAAGISESYLLDVGSERGWPAFREFLECAIQWRGSILAPLRSALGGYLPNDEELACVHDAVMWGHSEESILDMARVFKEWPKLKEFLKQSVFPLEYIEIGKFLAERKQHSLAGG